MEEFNLGTASFTIRARLDQLDADLADGRRKVERWTSEMENVTRRTTGGRRASAPSSAADHGVVDIDISPAMAKLRELERGAAASGASIAAAITSAMIRSPLAGMVNSVFSPNSSIPQRNFNMPGAPSLMLPPGRGLPPFVAGNPYQLQQGFTSFDVPTVRGGTFMGYGGSPYTPASRGPFIPPKEWLDQARLALGASDPSALKAASSFRMFGENAHMAEQFMRALPNRTARMSDLLGEAAQLRQDMPDTGAMVRSGTTFGAGGAGVHVRSGSFYQGNPSRITRGLLPASGESVFDPDFRFANPLTRSSRVPIDMRDPRAAFVNDMMSFGLGQTDMEDAMGLNPPSLDSMDQAAFEARRRSRGSTRDPQAVRERAQRIRAVRTTNALSGMGGMLTRKIPGVSNMMFMNMMFGGIELARGMQGLNAAQHLEDIGADASDILTSQMGAIGKIGGGFMGAIGMLAADPTGSIFGGVSDTLRSAQATDARTAAMAGRQDFLKGINQRGFVLSAGPTAQIEQGRRTAMVERDNLIDHARQMRDEQAGVDAGAVTAFRAGQANSRNGRQFDMARRRLPSDFTVTDVLESETYKSVRGELEAGDRERSANLAHELDLKRQSAFQKAQDVANRNFSLGEQGRQLAMDTARIHLSGSAAASMFGARNMPLQAGFASLFAEGQVAAMNADPGLMGPTMMAALGGLAHFGMDQFRALSMSSAMGGVQRQSAAAMLGGSRRGVLDANLAGIRGQRLGALAAVPAGSMFDELRGQIGATFDDMGKIAERDFGMRQKADTITFEFARSQQQSLLAEQPHRASVQGILGRALTAMATETDPQARRRIGTLAEGDLALLKKGWDDSIRFGSAGGVNPFATDFTGTNRSTEEDPKALVELIIQAIAAVEKAVGGGFSIQ
jgi:hypothetical protein